jgi:hypothetical protein
MRPSDGSGIYGPAKVPSGSEKALKIINFRRFFLAPECCISATAFRLKSARFSPSSIAAAVTLYFQVFQDRTKRHRPQRRTKAERTP